MNTVLPRRGPHANRETSLIFGELRFWKNRKRSSHEKRSLVTIESLKILCRRTGSELEEERLGFGLGEGSLLEDLDRLVDGSVKRLDLAKKELEGRLRAVLASKREVDEVPTQAEVVQYERRFSELNSHIQDKYQQTRKYYDTYNALLEIKDWMLKETSLLNSMSSQSQDAMVSAEGHMKLIASMEGIAKSSQQEQYAKNERLKEQSKQRDTTAS